MSEPNQDITHAESIENVVRDDFRIALKIFGDWLCANNYRSSAVEGESMLNQLLAYHRVFVDDQTKQEMFERASIKTVEQHKKFDYWQNEALAKMSKLDTLIERLRALNDIEAEYCNTHSQRNHIMSVRRTLIEALEAQAHSVRFEFAHPQADDIPF